MLACPQKAHTSYVTASLLRKLVLMQVQHIELHSVPTLLLPSASLQQYPGTITVILQGHLCNTVALGDHVHVTGGCHGADLPTPKGVSKLAHAAVEVGGMAWPL